MARGKQKKKKKREQAGSGAKRTGSLCCGLCGKSRRLTRTKCCGNWICDDEQTYVVFSFARNSCYRNHELYTLCGRHFREGHEGPWKDCPQCRADLEPEMYAYLGTNAYNFEKLENPPSYVPKCCSKCGATISLPEGGYSVKGNDYTCAKCFAADLPEWLRRRVFGG